MTDNFEIQMAEIIGISKRLPTPDEVREQKEMRQTVVNAIETLSEKNRLVTRLTISMACPTKRSLNI